MSQKDILRNDINMWDITNDLVYLAEVVIRANKILKENKFPLDKYEKTRIKLKKNKRIKKNC